jgi:hypothetical protein
LPDESEAVDLITHIAPSKSIGIRLHAEELASELEALGIGCRVSDRSDRSSHIHYHFGNSARSELLPMCLGRNQLVTVHDVIPRDKRLRPILLPIQRVVLSQHKLVVHSRYSRELLRTYMPRADPDIVRLAHYLHDHDHSPRLSFMRTSSLRIRAVIAGLLKEAKGLTELIVAATAFDDVELVLLGSPADAAVASRLAHLPRPFGLRMS